MKKQDVTPKHVVVFLLLATALFLVACGAGTSTVSAAQSEPVAVAKLAAPEEIAAVAGANQSGEGQEAIAVADASSEGPVESPVTAVDNSTVPDQAQGYVSGTGTHIPPTGELTADEIAALLYMREEEKLARDVYQAMYDIWGVPVFANIAESEQAHMDAVAYLLAAYDLADPASGNGPGEFENEQLQALYDELVAQGQRSLEDALLAGAAIEEIDILDLQERLAQTSNAAIIQTFENLLAGSVNHLGAFATNIERQTGAAYEPQYMSQSAYETLVNTISGRGNGAGGFSGNGQGYGSNSNAPGNDNAAGEGAPGGNWGGNGRGAGNGTGRWQNSSS